MRCWRVAVAPLMFLCACSNGGHAPEATAPVTLSTAAATAPESAAAATSPAPPGTAPGGASFVPVHAIDATSNTAVTLPSNLQPRDASNDGSTLLATAYDDGLYVLHSDGSSDSTALSLVRFFALPGAPEHAKYVDAAFGPSPAEFTVGLASFGAFAVSIEGNDVRPIDGLSSPNIARVVRVRQQSAVAEEPADAVLGFAFTPVGFADIRGGAQLVGPSGAEPAVVPAFEGLDPSSSSRVVDLAATRDGLVLATSVGLVMLPQSDRQWQILAKGSFTDLEALEDGRILAVGEHTVVLEGTRVSPLRIDGDLAPKVRGGIRSAECMEGGVVWLVLNRGAVVKAAMQHTSLRVELVLEAGQGVPQGPMTLLRMGKQRLLLGTEREGLHALQ